MPTFSTILLFSVPLSKSTSFFTFTHAHKCTPKTLFITSNKDQRHEHDLIRSSTSFAKACDSAECFGGRESLGEFLESHFDDCFKDKHENTDRIGDEVGNDEISQEKKKETSTNAALDEVRKKKRE